MRRGAIVGLIAALAAASAAADSVPPGLASVQIPVKSTRMNGFMLTASGSGPHALVVFLHGYPGNERNIDLAQAVRRVGYDALYFDYRGTWGSGGQFSFANALGDVAAVLAYVRSPEAVARFHIDPEKIILLGDSLGGALALLAAADDPGVACVAALSSWDMGAAAWRWSDHPDERNQLEDFFWHTTDPESGPVRGNPTAMIQEIDDSQADWDLAALAPSISDRRLLIVSDTWVEQDVRDYHALTDALAQSGAGPLLRTVTFDDDPVFSAHRAELADLVMDWLGRGCLVPRPS